MADIESLLSQLQEPGDDGVPETIYDDLRATHQSALEEVQTTAQAKIESLSQELSARDEQIMKLKSDNWDLFEQIPKSGDSEPEDGSVTEEEPQTLDDLIQDKE